MKFRIAVPIGVSLSDNSYAAKTGKPWQAVLVACSDPRYRTSTLDGLAEELGIGAEEIAPVYDFGGPALLVLGEDGVRDHLIMDIKMALEHGVTDVYLIQHTNLCRGLAGRGISYETPQVEFEGAVDLIKQATTIVRQRVPEVRIWGAVLLASESGKRFKFAWVDKVPPGVFLEG